MILPCISAEIEYTNYKDVDLNFYLGSNISIVKLNDKAAIDYASVNVLLLPQNDSNLKVRDIKFSYKPKAVVSSKHKATFIWNEINENKLSFGVTSNVNINNDFLKIRKKINFPVNFTEEYKQYTLPTNFIDINEVINDKAHEIVQGEDDMYSAVFNIAEFVRGNIKYDLNTITVKAVQKSSWVYFNKKGVCDEITNLFISMLRSAGIPARFVSGTVYSNIDDTWGNHGWAEVYFPDYGWMPFDVTFGQYGWVDPSHLKLSETFDSGEDSIEYNWRSRDTDLRMDPLTLTTNLNKLGNKFNSLFDIKISTLEDNKFGFGSYVPIEITVTNLNDYYLSTNIVLTKAPGLIDKNFKNILLKPKETKTYYFIGKLQDNLNGDFEYTGDIEAKESFGTNSFFNILIGKNYKIFSFLEIKSIIEKLDKRETKQISPSLNLNCKTEKESYYSDEDITIECKVKNKGNTLLKDVEICFKNKCSKVESLGINKEETIIFKTKNEKKISILAESDDLIARDNLEVEIIEVPNVFVSGISNPILNYKENINLSFTLNTDVKSYNTTILVNNKLFYLNDVNGAKEISFNTNGKELLKGLNVNVVYYDVKGNKYDKDFNFDIKINNLPLYLRIFKIITFSR